MINMTSPDLPFVRKRMGITNEIAYTEIMKNVALEFLRK